MVRNRGVVAQRVVSPALVGRGDELAALTAADEVGLSRRHLGSLFHAEYGVTPKQYQRIARFSTSSRALSRQVRRGTPSLAGLAAACGFADQAHLGVDGAGRVFPDRVAARGVPVPSRRHGRRRHSLRPVRPTGARRVSVERTGR